jgi:hypothetical protein
MHRTVPPGLPATARFFSFFCVICGLIFLSVSSVLNPYLLAYLIGLPVAVGRRRIAVAIPSRSLPTPSALESASLQNHLLCQDCYQTPEARRLLVRLTFFPGAAVTPLDSFLARPHNLSASCASPHGIRIPNTGRCRSADQGRKRLDGALHWQGARPLALARRRSQGRGALPNRTTAMGKPTGAGVAGHHRLATPGGLDLTARRPANRLARKNDTPPTKRRGASVPIDLNSASWLLATRQ